MHLHVSYFMKNYLCPLADTNSCVYVSFLLLAAQAKKPQMKRISLEHFKNVSNMLDDMA